MKNSFFLVIPEQQTNAEQLATYEKAAVNQWISELPTANLSLATRLFYDFIGAFNKVEMSAQQRLDALELLREPFLTIRDFLRSRFMRSGFPKGENEQKTLDLVVSIEKHFTIGYWIVTRELTRRDVGWFQGKNAALAIQRTIKGLSGIVVTHYMMFLPVPDWVWIDLHSLYKLSVKIKKETVKVADTGSLSGKVSSVDDCYKQVLLLSLADPSGLMQKEVQQVYDFIEKISCLVRIEKQAVKEQKVQCVILMDEDAQPYFDTTGGQVDSSMIYMNLHKLHKALMQTDKFCSKDEARFSSMQILKNTSESLPAELFVYLVQRWKGIKLQGFSVFPDRLDRYFAIGLDATHSLQSSMGTNKNLEFLAVSFSDRELSCKFEKEGMLSIGSLVSFRKTNEPEGKRSLGVVIKITMPKHDGHIVFELTTLTQQSYSVTYASSDTEPESNHNKALLYGVKDKVGERSYIIMDSFRHKDEDIMRMHMNDDNLPIILGDRKNIGLGYWQFECRRLEEKQVQKQTKKKGYDFI